MSFNFQEIIRKNVREILIGKANPLSNNNCAILLDKNENAFGSPTIKWYNRYPTVEPVLLKAAIANIKALNKENILLGNGNRECVDVLFRCFCEAGKDNMIVCLPAEDLYQTVAQINDVTVKQVPLLDNFQLDILHLESVTDANTKMIFIASPNGITGNAMNRQDIELILNNFDGLVVIDETYINFSRQKSFASELADYPNLVLLQNFDIAWGLAGLGVSMLFASEEIILILQSIQPPHPINTPTQELLLKALGEVGMVNDMIKELVQMRVALKAVLIKFPFIEKVYPSDANFLLVKLTDAKSVHEFLMEKSIAVKDVSHMRQCENCLRITIGTEVENTKLIEALVAYHDHNQQSL